MGSKVKFKRKENKNLSNKRKIGRGTFKTQLTLTVCKVTCSKLTKATLKQGVKNFQS